MHLKLSTLRFSHFRSSKCSAYSTRENVLNQRLKYYKINKSTMSCHGNIGFAKIADVILSSKLGKEKTIEELHVQQRKLFD